jgi:hypothetical protein
VLEVGKIVKDYPLAEERVAHNHRVVRWLHTLCLAIASVYMYTRTYIYKNIYIYTHNTTFIYTYI